MKTSGINSIKMLIRIQFLELRLFQKIWKNGKLGSIKQKDVNDELKRAVGIPHEAIM